MSAQTKRMQLSRDQRAVLEAVYVIEKLPDASLRERLGSYLSLTDQTVLIGERTDRGVCSKPPAGAARGRAAALGCRCSDGPRVVRERLSAWVRWSVSLRVAAVVVCV